MDCIIVQIEDKECVVELVGVGLIPGLGRLPLGWSPQMKVRLASVRLVDLDDIRLHLYLFLLWSNQHDFSIDSFDLHLVGIALFTLIADDGLFLKYNRFSFHRDRLIIVLVTILL